MRIRFAVVIVFVCNAFCFGQQLDKKAGTKLETSDKLAQVLDSLHVKGSILIYDAQLQTYYSNNFKWAKAGKIPASTFKIPNSMIALETGVIESDTTLIKWDGKKRDLPVWEQDLTFKKALQVSCVPCYQEIARKIGTKRMRLYLAKLNYPGMKVDSLTRDNFWLQGKSAITQFQQIDFLYRFYNAQLPIAARTTTMVKRMLVIDSTANYTLSGKTGYANGNGKKTGWFVGYVQRADKGYYFATNIEPVNEDIDGFLKARIAGSKAALKKMGIID